MFADPPPQLLISPDLRRQLQQKYEEALRLSVKPNADFRRIHALLAECLRADPGNTHYLDALLANLRRREGQRRKSWWCTWLERWRSPPTPASNGRSKAGEGKGAGAERSPEYLVLSTAPRRLWQRPTNPSLLRELADAAAALEFDQAELRYLQAARELAPDDPTTLRMLARALTRQGRFEEAVGPWFAVAALTADAEAIQATQDLRGSQEAVETEELLAREHSAAGADLAMLEKREDARLARSALRIELARRRAASDEHPRAQSLVARLEAEHNRLEIDILNLRAERWPGDIQVRVELARRLKQAGNFSGAVQRLEEAQQLSPDEAAVLVELGENWQHLRQFAKALGYYEQAIAASSSAPALLNLARYRGAALAAALGNHEAARQWLTAIVASDSAFKDARERLDNLPAS
jgi:tetratricopeptide (TPR) repeat protein